ncbi:hypothetical protein PSACC_00479 [Paramicrosporidium saccamoebae]|uniref:TLC domain-containing protein n=1 Tax=Paramicrosporidium saccamoebae TaxID=1246581 RepID=A0A2H9TPR2_9FUNG|nr:hypothetical protein PSACC_00479 [Paramicrosporidium saccamoebae]
MSKRILPIELQASGLVTPHLYACGLVHRSCSVVAGFYWPTLRAWSVPFLVRTMGESIHATIRTAIEKFLSKQNRLKELPQHGYQILVAFVLFTATSWISYYFIAPSLVRYSKKKKLKDDEHARAKWGHMAASFLHAIIVCCWSLSLWYDNELAHTIEDRVFGYSREFGSMFSFSVGYFLWDVMCCAWRDSQLLSAIHDVPNEQIPLVRV